MFTLFYLCVREETDRTFTVLKDFPQKLLNSKGLSSTTFDVNNCAKTQASHAFLQRKTEADEPTLTASEMIMGRIQSLPREFKTEKNPRLKSKLAPNIIILQYHLLVMWTAGQIPLGFICQSN